MASLTCHSDEGPLGFDKPSASGSSCSGSAVTFRCPFVRFRAEDLYFCLLIEDPTWRLPYWVRPLHAYIPPSLLWLSTVENGEKGKENLERKG